LVKKSVQGADGKCGFSSFASSAKRNVYVSRGTAQRLMMRGHRSTGGGAIRAEPSVTIWKSSFRSALTTIERPTGGARVALSVMANATKITSGFVGKENVGTEIYLLRGPFEAPANPGKKGKIYVGVDGDEHISVLGDGLGTRQ
jgi:hypothetical protein